MNENLKSLSADIFDQVNETARHCVAHRSMDQLPGRPMTLSVGWPGAQRVWQTRDALNYRASSLMWHIDLLRSTSNAEIPRILNKGLIPQMDPNAVNHALSRIGYAFDDLIFNSMSLFDYLAKFISSVGFWNDSETQHQWKGLLNSKNIKYMEHEHLVAIVQETNRVWVKQLDGFRSQIIHNGPEVGGLSCETVHTEEGTKYAFSFYVPEKAIAKLPIFLSAEKTTLMHGAEGIALQSLVYVAEILKLMRSIEYECLHDPRQNDRKRKSERHKSLNATE